MLRSRGGGVMLRSRWFDKSFTLIVTRSGKVLHLCRSFVLF
jgi:hypothetical protein